MNRTLPELLPLARKVLNPKPSSIMSPSKETLYSKRKKLILIWKWSRKRCREIKTTVSNQQKMTKCIEIWLWRIALNISRPVMTLQIRLKRNNSREIGNSLNPLLKPITKLSKRTSRETQPMRSLQMTPTIDDTWKLLREIPNMRTRDRRLTQCKTFSDRIKISSPHNMQQTFTRRSLKLKRKTIKLSTRTPLIVLLCRLNSIRRRCNSMLTRILMRQIWVLQRKMTSEISKTSNLKEESRMLSIILNLKTWDSSNSKNLPRENSRSRKKATHQTFLRAWFSIPPRNVTATSIWEMSQSSACMVVRATPSVKLSLNTRQSPRA